MTDNFEKKVAVDGPVVNAGELGSSTFSPGQARQARWDRDGRWRASVVLRLLRDEPVQLLSLGVEIFRLDGVTSADASLKPQGRSGAGGTG